MAYWELVLAALAAWAWCVRAQLAEPPLCPSEAAQRCVRGGHGQNEYTYTVDGMNLLVEYTDGGYYALECPENLTLDNSALPRFKSQLRVNKVHLVKCPPPRVSYAAALTALNVVVLDKLQLISAGHLTADHLAHLEDLPAFELIKTEVAPGALAALRGLRRLFLDSVRLPPDELLRLPPTLEVLDLMRMHTDVPAGVLQALPELVNVTVRDAQNVSVALGGKLQVVALDTLHARVPSALPPSLSSLTVFGWDERRPQPWAPCGLRSLEARDAMAEALPAHWLQACGELRVLRVHDAANLSALDASALRGARHLQELRLKSCALAALPPGLLDDAVELNLLDLSGNKLMMLPSGLFAKTTSLQTLNLSRNKLTTGVYTSLSAVTSLTTLQLSNNDLKDSCGNVSDITVRGMSPLQYLEKLTELNLRNTNTSLICRDWRENMPRLKLLDLSNNNITAITYTDLQFRGAEDVQLDLSGNNVTGLYYTEHDYQLVVTGTHRSRAVVQLDATLACDCDAYWAALALRNRSDHVRLSARCARHAGPAGPELAAAPLDALVCAAPELCAGAPPGCACGARGRLLRVTCARAGLANAAQVLEPVAAALRAQSKSPDDFDWQLYLAQNRIADLDAADLPMHLSVLDLRNNSLSVLSAETARALVADVGRRVWLAGNELACTCDVLVPLQEHRRALADYGDVTCADGSLLAGADAGACAAGGPSAAAVGAAAALLTLLAGALLAGMLWHPALRLRLKAALHQRGWLPAAAEPDDDGRRFDVFLSFSHGDERFVRDELVARLESGPAPYRLCVHYRDWAPGGWIPAQIAASVRASRRTVAVVSEHFLRSAWARAELQEAYALALRDARPRLVVVLLDEPARLPLDDRLRRYLATNTYVRWGDPWFWQKLRLALPRGRGADDPAVEAGGPDPAVGAGRPDPAVGAGRPDPAMGAGGPDPTVEAGGPDPAAGRTDAAAVGPAAAAAEPDEITAGPVAAAPNLTRPTLCSVPPPPSSSSSSSSSPASSESSADCSSDSAMELARLMTPTCGAQYASDIVTFAAPLRSQV